MASLQLYVSTSLDPRPNPRGRVWGKTLPGSVLSAGMPPSVLMREWTSFQPTSVRVRLMTGSEYTVEHRNFENWSSTCPIALKIWRRKFAEFRDRGIPARHFRIRLFPRLFLVGWVWGPDYVSTNNYSPIWSIAWDEVAMATDLEKACKCDPAHDFHYEQNRSMALLY